MARPRQFTDAEILEAARRCFLEHGASVSTSHIAAEIGLSQASLFKRFGTKENLLLSALAPDETPPWITRLVDGPSQAPFEEQLVAIALDAYAFMKDLTPRLMVLKSAGMDPTVLLDRFEVPPPVRAVTQLTHFFAAARDRGLIAIDDPSALAIQFMGSIHVRVFFGHVFGQAFSPEQDHAYIRTAMHNLCHGICSQEAR